MYRFQNPPYGVNRDRVDQVWDGFETTVPQAIVRATKCRETDGDRIALVNYVAAAGVRHPHFEEAVNRWRRGSGMPQVADDGVQVERLAVLARSLLLVRGFRWRLVHSPKNAHRFILNDRGWTYVGEQGRPGRGLFVPLNGRLAMLGWLAPSVLGAFDHLTLRPTWVKWLNAATWTEAPEYVVAHPQDAQMLRGLRTADEVAPELTMEGAYRRRRGLLFDDE
jgi:hypothetical protein